ncbi:MAG: DUF692 domain-containing protein [Burkholderiales bacterium]
MTSVTPVHGAGLGLRRELIAPLQAGIPPVISFFEIAPENWMEMGGASGRQFRGLVEQRPFVAHGLSLSLGGPQPLDRLFLARLRRFLDEHGIALYTEHLSYTTDDGQLYDLMPIPFTDEAVRHVARRIAQVQDALGRRLAIENASYYVKAPIDQMGELDFIGAVLREADCDLHLDVNNVYVNSVNHGFDPREFLLGLPRERVVYLHMAGHYREAEDLIIDTHGADVIDPVWTLLDFTYRHFGVHPTLLERDFNIPPLRTLVKEVTRIDRLQRRHAGTPGRALQRAAP